MFFYKDEFSEFKTYVFFEYIPFFIIKPSLLVPKYLRFEALLRSKYLYFNKEHTFATFEMCIGKCLILSTEK